MILWLALLFALAALAYASVGFGGGSTYNALLALSGIEYALIPAIALACNIVVVTGGVFRFWRAGLYDWRAILPLVAISAPAALLGGLIVIGEGAFFLLLGGALLFSAVAMTLPADQIQSRKLPPGMILVISGGIGLLAGLSGIGGGIFMAPMLYLVRWAEAKRIAAFASFYILINSLAGLTGQLTKSGISTLAEPFVQYWPLLLAVLLGGQIGSMVGIRLFNARLLRWVTAILVGYVAIRLLWQGWFAL
ncbi:MAG: sulfite exporter TauE/SafE family protein [Sphingorhabdus sp.]